MLPTDNTLLLLSHSNLTKRSRLLHDLLIIRSEGLACFLGPPCREKWNARDGSRWIELSSALNSHWTWVSAVLGPWGYQADWPVVRRSPSSRCLSSRLVLSSRWKICRRPTPTRSVVAGEGGVHLILCNWIVDLSHCGRLDSARQRGFRLFSNWIFFFARSTLSLRFSVIVRASLIAVQVSCCVENVFSVCVIVTLCDFKREKVIAKARIVSQEALARSRRHRHLQCLQETPEDSISSVVPSSQLCVPHAMTASCRNTIAVRFTYSVTFLLNYVLTYYKYFGNFL